MEPNRDPRTVETIMVRAAQLEAGDIWKIRVGSETRGVLVGYDASDARHWTRAEADRWGEVTHVVFGPEHGVAAVWVSDQSVDGDLDTIIEKAGDGIAQISEALAPFGFVRYQLDGLVEIQTFPYRSAAEAEKVGAS